MVDTLDVTAALTAAGVDYTDQVVIRSQSNENFNDEFVFIDSVKLGRAPLTAVDRDMTGIPDGGMDVLGTVLTQTQMLTYTITNNGDFDLDVSGGVATLNDMGVANLVITPPTATTIAPGASDTFTATFDPIVGNFSFDMEVTAVDPHLGDTSYTISVSGTAEDPLVDLDVQRPAMTSIADGGVDAQGMIAPAMMQTLTYTIENLGNIEANITGATIAGATNATATVTSNPAATVAPAATTTFDVEYQADANGPFSFDVIVASDDPDEGMYTITVSGDADDGMGAGGAGGGATTSSTSSGAGGAGGSSGSGGEDVDAGGGCGCRTANGTNSGSAGWLALLGLGLAISRRRRRNG